MQARTFDFEVHGGEIVDSRGKSDWPDMVNVTMSKSAAWDLFYSLMMQLRDGAETVQYAHMGQLKEYVEE